MSILAAIFTCIITFLAGVVIGVRRCRKVDITPEEVAKLKADIEKHKADVAKYRKISEDWLTRYNSVSKKHNKLVDILTDVMNRKKVEE